MPRAEVLRILGPPDDRNTRADWLDYQLSPVASFTVRFERGRVVEAGYGADSPPPFGP
jgi:hypothetical protein